MLITDFNSRKGKTGFNLNIPILDSAQSSGKSVNFLKKYFPFKMKVSDLKKLKISPSIFFNLDEGDYKDQYITYGVYNVDVHIFAGPDSVYSSKTDVETSNFEAELISAGLTKIISVPFNDRVSGNVLNIDARAEKEIIFDVDNLKSDLGIESDEISFFVVFVVQGSMKMLSSMTSSVSFSALYNIDFEGDFFFNSVSADGLEIGDPVLTFKKLPDAEAVARGLAMADGRALSRAAYPDAFAYYGTMYGSGDGASTFNIPDARSFFLRIDNGGNTVIDPDYTSRVGYVEGADNAGTVQPWQTQRFSGNTYYIANMRSVGGPVSVGALKYTPNVGVNFVAGGTESAGTLSFDSKDSISPNAMQSSDYQTNGVNIGVHLYLKVKK